MAVVIQEFEVQTAPEPKAANQSTDASEAESKPSAHDIENILRHQAERCARVRAH